VAELEVRVLWLYPDHMNIYADRGNIAVLERRCVWRGIRFSLATAGPGDEFDPHSHELLYMGGGQDRDQVLVAHDLVKMKGEAIEAALAREAGMLAVCGGYQLLGHAYELPGGKSLPGLGVADLHTVREPGKRLIGNVVIDTDLGDGVQRLAGFENHGGRTYLGPDEKPLGQVITGFGNNGKDGHEGVRRGRVIGTYLHGPLLPKNARLADVLIEWALEARYGDPPGLASLDDTLEDHAHDCAVRAARRRRG
jgi:lipid II isoglutaminyl synthase (glutamine-hydrolysing)